MHLVNPFNPYSIDRYDAERALDAISQDFIELEQSSSLTTVIAIRNLWVAVSYLTQQYHNNPVLQVAQRLEDSQ